MRNFIDGGMAAAIRDPVVLRRTLTVLRRRRPDGQATGIDDRSTISLVLVDRAGTVQWQGHGGFDPGTATSLESAL